MTKHQLIRSFASKNLFGRPSFSFRYAMLLQECPVFFVKAFATWVIPPVFDFGGFQIQTIWRRSTARAGS